MVFAGDNRVGGHSWGLNDGPEVGSHILNRRVVDREGTVERLVAAAAGSKADCLHIRMGERPDKK